jgi:hypothetical protein
MSANLTVVTGDGPADDPVSLIVRACQAGVPNQIIDQRLRLHFPKITVAEMVAAYREAGRRLAAEADALEAELARRQGAR